MPIELTTKVLPGHQIDVSATRLNVGDDVHVKIEKTSHPDYHPVTTEFVSWLDSLPRSTRTLEEWDEFDRWLRAERDAWD